MADHTDKLANDQKHVNRELLIIPLPPVRNNWYLSSSFPRRMTNQEEMPFILKTFYQLWIIKRGNLFLLLYYKEIITTTFLKEYWSKLRSLTPVKTQILKKISQTFSAHRKSEDIGLLKSQAPSFTEGTPSEPTTHFGMKMKLHSTHVNETNRIIYHHVEGKV